LSHHHDDLQKLNQRHRPNHLAHPRRHLRGRRNDSGGFLLFSFLASTDDKGLVLGVRNSDFLTIGGNFRDACEMVAKEFEDRFGHWRGESLPEPDKAVDFGSGRNQ
jgi:hypothetical protein